MNILVTNYDGQTEGLRILLEAAKKLGKAYALVPNRQRSAVSNALTLHKAIRVDKIDQDLFEINGTPADAVIFGTHSKEMEKPDLILSGINWGDNASFSSLMSSGTVGACWQAALEGIPSIAISMYQTRRDWRDRSGWGDQKKLRKIIFDVLKQLKPRLRGDSFFNVNLPDDISSPKILHSNKMQKLRFKTQITKRFDPNGKAYYWISGSNGDVEKGTDLYEISVNKNVTITEVPLNFFENNGKSTADDRES
jgi:5'-nucleotidase